MAYKKVALMSFFAGLGGVCWYGYFNEWIILRNPWEIPHHTTAPTARLFKKEIILYFWLHDEWRNESITVRIAESLQEQALTILHAWFYEAAQSGFIPHPCTLETALYDARTSCLYLSCTTSPLDIQKSTYENLIVLESLLKTIRENIPHRIQSIQLLINHTILEHPYIICTKPMPISGFALLQS